MCGNDDDGTIFPEHSRIRSPVLHAPRDNISRKGKSLTPTFCMEAKNKTSSMYNVVFWSYFRIMSNPPGTALGCSSRNKKQNSSKRKVLVQEKLELTTNTWSKRLGLGPECPVFEKMEEIISMYEHFPVYGSAWGAIWGRLLKTEFSTKTNVHMW